MAGATHQDSGFLTSQVGFESEAPLYSPRRMPKSRVTWLVFWRVRHKDLYTLFRAKLRFTPGHFIQVYMKMYQVCMVLPVPGRNQ